MCYLCLKCCLATNRYVVCFQYLFVCKINVKMSCYKEPYCENKKFKLTGSQINLTSRSDQTVLGSFSYRNRPCSAAHSCRTHVDSRIKYTRPKSAECTGLNHSESESFQWPTDNKVCGDLLITVSDFTGSSSKLLQNLLEPQSLVESKSSSSEKFPKISGDCKLEVSTGEKYFGSENRLEFLKMDHLNTDTKYQDMFQKENVRINERMNFPEEKTVRFCEWPQLELLPKKKFDEKCTCFRSHESLYPHFKSNFISSCQEIHTHQTKKTSDKVKELEIQRVVGGGDSDLFKTLNSDTESESFKSREISKEEKACLTCQNSPKEYSSNKFQGTTLIPNEALKSSSLEANAIVELPTEDKSSEISDKLTESSDEEICEDYKKNEEKDAEHDCVHPKLDVSDSTYDEIVGLLKTLDEEDSESVNLESKPDPILEIPEGEIASPKDKIDYFGAVSSYLEEMERNDDSFHENYVNSQKRNAKHFSSPRLEELLNKNSVELAHEVFTLKIQIEDQKKGIKLLKDTLSEMKGAKKVVELEHQEALQKVSSDAEALVQRHQKFIKQLLNEKKNLNETVSKLVQDLKSGEERYKRNIKAMEEKHLIEIKRAKEAQAVADKIRREKWMESKTKKLKEMTVKGLEPELSRMAARQQEEITELRNLQKAELEAVELRAARRTSELMDELRAELTKEKERAIAKETATLRANMEKEFEDERNKFQQYYQNLKERIRKLEEKLSNQEYEFKQRMLDFKQEEEKKRQKIIREHEENLEEVRKQHLVELKNLKEVAEEEKEVAINNCKKAQAVKFNEREAELHQQYKKERDQEIEMVIETLEKESSQAQLELNRANEGKMKRLKDKMEAEIKEMEVNETALKEKLTEIKAKLAEKEDAITELNSQMRKLQTELTFFKKSCDEMSLEKTKLKEIIRGEFESKMNDYNKEKENLERDIAVLKELHVKELAKKDQQNVEAKHEMQKELTRVYSRIKTAVNKKEKIIESLREENEAINQRCRQLEYMLDQQRRNLLLQ